MKFAGILSASVILWTLPCTSMSADYYVAGVGNESCGSFIQEASGNTGLFRMEMSWIQGFLTAENGETVAYLARKGGTTNTKQLDILDGIDLGAQKLWVQNYCSAHPLDNLNKTSTAFAEELLKRLGERLKH